MKATFTSSVQLINIWKAVTKNQFRKMKNSVVTLKSKNIKQLETVAEKNSNYFQKNIDCLQCANCCKTASPIIKPSDTKRISGYLGISAAQFISTYLRSDDDNDYVVNTLPCPFLSNDNSCKIYEVRPLDCSEYPHTRGIDYTKRINYQSNNISFCPISYHTAAAILTHFNEKGNLKS